MGFIQTDIPDLLIFEPRIFEDDRGYFYESFNHKNFEELSLYKPFVQDNQARSSYGVIRGLHYQLAPFAQAKLVRVIRGKVLDVAVDIREGSPTYGKHFSIILSGENKKQLYVPRGFAHGYAVLEDDTEFFYKCDNFYSKEQEGGIALDDSTLNIDWMLPKSDWVLSAKDAQNPSFGKHKAFTKEDQL